MSRLSTYQLANEHRKGRSTSGREGGNWPRTGLIGAVGSQCALGGRSDKMKVTRTIVFDVYPLITSSTQAGDFGPNFIEPKRREVCKRLLRIGFGVYLAYSRPVTIETALPNA